MAMTMKSFYTKTVLTTDKNMSGIRRSENVMERVNAFSLSYILLITLSDSYKEKRKHK